MQKVKKFVYLYGFDLNFQVMIMVESRRKKFFYFFVNSSYLLWSYAKKYIIS